MGTSRNGTSTAPESILQPGRVGSGGTEEDFGHPRGTLAIVLIYAVIFALSWGGLYVWQFLERGAPTH